MGKFLLENSWALKCGLRIGERMKTKIIPEMGIEIETKIQHKGKTYAECEKEIPKGWRISTYEILQKLRNSEHIDILNLKITCEFVQNPDEISRKNGRVAGVFAASDRGGLGLRRNAEN